MIRAPINSIIIKNNYVNLWLLSAKKLFGGWTNNEKPVRPRLHKTNDNVHKILIDPDNGTEYMKSIPWWKACRVTDINKDSPIIDKWLKYKKGDSTILFEMNELEKIKDLVNIKYDRNLSMNQFLKKMM